MNPHPIQSGTPTWRRLPLLAMLFIGALPDAMVVPVLRQLTVERYGVGVGDAHAFMAVNLIGAILAAGLIGRMLRRWSERWVLCSAALVNGLLLWIMALPIGFVPTLALRAIEGGADLLVYAVLFARLARVGPASTRGRRMGAAGTVMLLGIAGGIGFGGVVGADHSESSLWAGGAACLVVAALAVLLVREGGSERAPARTHRAFPGRASAMICADRAIGGLLATTLPIYMTSAAGLDTPTTGGLIGLCMLMTALGAWPAGRLVDRFGWRPLRLGAGAVYAGGFAATPVLLGSDLAAAGAVLVAVGLAGAVLFACSLSVAASGRGASEMASYHASGNAGFLLGTMGAGALLTGLGGAEPDPGAYLSVFLLFAAFHAAMTAGSAARVPVRDGTLRVPGAPA